MHPFGEYSLTLEAFAWVLRHCPPGSHVLELGAGAATRAMAACDLKVTSVEHDAKWASKVPGAIHAPIVDRWYDTSILETTLPRLQYSLLIIDGPPRGYDRTQILGHLDLFDLSVAILIDDTHRNDGDTIAKALIDRLAGRKAVQIKTWNPRHHAMAIMPAV